MIVLWFLPIPTRVPTVNSEKSIFHSSNGSKGLLWKIGKPRTLFHVESISSVTPWTPLPWGIWLGYSWGDEDNVFCELCCLCGSYTEDIASDVLSRSTQRMPVTSVNTSHNNINEFKLLKHEYSLNKEKTKWNNGMEREPGFPVTCNAGQMTLPTMGIGPSAWTEALDFMANPDWAQ